MPTYQACQWFGVTPQAYYQARKRDLRKEAEAQLILALVREIRKRHPRMGAVGNTYDNALAEGVNGILKTEYLLGSLFPSKSRPWKPWRKPCIFTTLNDLTSPWGTLPQPIYSGHFDRERGSFRVNVFQDWTLSTPIPIP